MTGFASSAPGSLDRRQQRGATGVGGAVKLTRLTVPRGLARAVTFVTFATGELRRRGASTVTFVTFGVTRCGGRGAQRAIPGRGETAGAGARPQAVGAFPAHSDRRRGAGYVAAALKRDDEAQLLVGGPAIMAGASDRRLAAVMVVHRPGWSKETACRTGKSGEF